MVPAPTDVGLQVDNLEPWQATFVLVELVRVSNTNVLKANMWRKIPGCADFLSQKKALAKRSVFFFWGGAEVGIFFCRFDGTSRWFQPAGQRGGPTGTRPADFPGAGGPSKGAAPSLCQTVGRHDAERSRGPQGLSRRMFGASGCGVLVLAAAAVLIMIGVFCFCFFAPCGGCDHAGPLLGVVGGRSFGEVGALVLEIIRSPQSVCIQVGSGNWWASSLPVDSCMAVVVKNRLTPKWLARSVHGTKD